LVVLFQKLPARWKPVRPPVRHQRRVRCAAGYGRLGRLNSRTKVPGPDVRTRTSVESVDLSAAGTDVDVAVISRIEGSRPPKASVKIQ
jgi:hypothetical protein